ncbi:MAG: hypothetical protein DRJ03_11025 [Chloroflexi bacterium]|nr:MAG: hypothetical protein DRI81_09290 [Chloroflexota bacterium]RLC85639.1 MAG: hypothetical protein DRJ03_11025 [Chloroflexota bacterium]
MSIGAILVGVACALVVGAYLARPFRRTEIDPDRAIEAWVAQARAEKAGKRESRETGAQRSRRAEETVNFCSKCGRSVGPDDHFCPGCGAKLPRGTK